MHEAVAETDSTHVCGACGGGLQWNPARQTLTCGSCGSPAALTEVPHFDLVRHETPLASAPSVVAGDARVEVRCASCDAVSRLPPGVAAEICPFCGSTRVSPYRSKDAALAPGGIVPMQVGADAARDLAHAWCRSRWLAPRKLKRLALTDTAQGVYVPAWVFGATVTAHWDAVSKGTQGESQLHCDDVIVPATGSMPEPTLRAIEPFPAELLVDYHPQFVAGWTVQRADVALSDAITVARRRLVDLLRVRDKQTRSNVPYTDVRYDDERYALVLLPVWLLTYRYLGRPYQMTINGTTGNSTGTWPYSRIKVALATFAAVEVLLTIYLGPEAAVQLPWMLLEGLWWLITLPFSSS